MTQSTPNTSYPTLLEIENYFKLMAQYQVTAMEIPGVFIAQKPLIPLVTEKEPEPASDELQDYDKFHSLPENEQDLALRKMLGKV